MFLRTLLLDYLSELIFSNLRLLIKSILGLELKSGIFVIPPDFSLVSLIERKPSLKPHLPSSYNNKLYPR